MVSDELRILRHHPGWTGAVARLTALAQARGAEAQAAAQQYAGVYAGRRGSVVLDVVASRQRRYVSRVLPLVKRWQAAHPPGSLTELAESPPDAPSYGLLPSEPLIMHTVARNLLDLADRLHTNEDQACRTWADSVRGLEHASTLDPMVGAVPGIGLALFAYLRMRCGADALKPDLRVARVLRELGFTVPGDSHSIIVLARAAAAEIDFNSCPWTNSSGYPTSNPSRPFGRLHPLPPSAPSAERPDLPSSGRWTWAILDRRCSS